MTARPMTRWALLLAACASGALLAASSVRAEPVASEPIGPTPALFPHQKPFSKMTLSQVEAFQVKALHHYRSVVHSYLAWRKANSTAVRSMKVELATATIVPPTVAVTHVRCAALGIMTPPHFCWYAKATRWTAHELAKTRAQLSARQRARQRAAAQPAHLALWRCIERGESGGDGVHPGSESASNGTHFNVLQMTDPWAGHDPIGQSYATIEAWAEQEYAANGYSRSWLEGQWGQTISPCWQYAT